MATPITPHGRTIEITMDDRDFRKKMKAIEQATPEGTRQALYGLAVLIFGDSQRFVPVDTGTLKASGGIEGPYTNEFGNPEVLIFYGGPAAGYALYVHEDLGARHDDPTTSKFLEGPFIAHVENIEVAAGIAIAKELKRQGAY